MPSPLNAHQSCLPKYNSGFNSLRSGHTVGKMFQSELAKYFSSIYGQNERSGNSGGHKNCKSIAAKVVMSTKVVVISFGRFVQCFWKALLCLCR